MRDQLFDPGARKRTVSLTVNGDLYDRARGANLPVSRIAEEAIAAALRQRMAAAIRAGIAKDVAALDRVCAEHGDPALELQEMFALDGGDAV